MKARVKSGLWLASCVLVVGCGDPEREADAGADDSGVPVDSGVLPDGGGDAGWDVGVVPDAGVSPDAGPPADFGLVPDAGMSEEMPPPIEGQDVDHCAARLETQGAGWCEIRANADHPSISSVYPNLEGEEGRRIRMIVGPAAVLIAWNSAAFDPIGEALYFWGGGHNDYGGNEVYRFELRSGTWTRLTDPSPLDRLYVAADYGQREAKPWRRLCWMPDTARVPGASHTYDGLTYHPGSRTLFVSSYGAATGSCLEDEEDAYRDSRLVAAVREGEAVRWASVGLYEFNPHDTMENGLAPRTWRRVFDYDAFGAARPGYPKSEPLPDGRLAVGPQHQIFAFDPLAPDADALQVRFNGIADRGIGALYFDPGREVLWSLHRGALLRIHAETGENLQTILHPYDGEARVRHGNALAVGSGGRLLSWDGTSTIYALDPDEESPVWQRTDWGERGPPVGNAQVYGKWVYLARLDVFVGISTDDTGVWVYRHHPRWEVPNPDPS